jgi:hypothetical protein
MITKKDLYPTYYRSLERNNKLMDAATRKALDLPLEDDVHITTNKTGIGGGALVACVGLASAAAIAIAAMFAGNTPQPATPDIEAKYTVEHFDQFGDPIYVPPITNDE